MPYKDRSSPAAKAADARYKKKYRATPEGRAKTNADIARYRSTPEGKRKQSERQKIWASTPEARAKIKAAHERRWRENPNYRLAHLLRSRLNKALKRSGARVSEASAVRDLGCSFDAFKAHIEALWQPGMTWDNHGTEWHLDHKKALGLFDLIDPTERAAATHYTNLQPLFTVDHQRKTAADLLLIRERNAALYPSSQGEVA